MQCGRYRISGNKHGAERMRPAKEGCIIASLMSLGRANYNETVTAPTQLYSSSRTRDAASMVSLGQNTLYCMYELL